MGGVVETSKFQINKDLPQQYEWKILQAKNFRILSNCCYYTLL